MSKLPGKPSLLGLVLFSGGGMFYLRSLRRRATSRRHGPRSRRARPSEA